MGHAVTLTFDLLTPKTDAKIQTSNFQDIALIKPKSAFSSMLDPAVTLYFGPSDPKLEAFILCPKCTSSESFTKILQYFSRYCFNHVWNAQTETGTARIHNASSYYVGEGTTNKESKHNLFFELLIKSIFTNNTYTPF